MPVLASIFEDSEDEAYALLGVDLVGDATTPETIELLKDNTRKFSKSVTITTNEIIRKQLIEGTKKNETISEISNRIEDTFTGIKKTKADLIARTESARIAGAGTEQAFIDSGVVEGKQWVAEPTACEFCSALDGVTASLGENFYNKGDTITGVDGGTYTFDYDELPYQPVHPNCRCSIVPILIKT